MPSAVVVGSGIAGLLSSLKLARAGWKITVVTKSEVTDSSTNRAQGGIAAVISSVPDELEEHIEDTRASGGGHCDDEMVRIMVEEGPIRVNELIQEGVEFDKEPSGRFSLTKEGGHGQQRILHAKDATGAEIESVLANKVSMHENITILEGCQAIDLILNERDSTRRNVIGLWAFDSSEAEVKTILSDVVILATGGAGSLYRVTTNPSVATGDGVAMGSRAGAATSDLEFVQFHPTSFHSPSGGEAFLISEALRGAGGILLDVDSHQRWRSDREKALLSGNKPPPPEDYSFTLEHSSFGSLATRDVVARAIDKVTKAKGDEYVLLVTEHLDESRLVDAFPTIAKRLDEHGIKLGTDPIPVSPAAHYMVGGLKVDSNGRVHQASWVDERPAGRVDPLNQLENSNIDGFIENLYAIGEVASTGVHGANRLASNSLLEAVVFASRCVDYLITHLPDTIPKQYHPKWRAEGLSHLVEHAPLKHDLAALQATMTDDVGVFKRTSRLSRASRRISLLDAEVDLIWRRCLPTRELVELRNLTHVARLVVSSSLARTINIGLHWNDDFA